MYTASAISSAWTTNDRMAPLPICRLGMLCARTESNIFVVFLGTERGSQLKPGLQPAARSLRFLHQHAEVLRDLIGRVIDRLTTDLHAVGNGLLGDRNSI